MTPVLLTATVTRPVICNLGAPNVASLLAWARAGELGMQPTREHIDKIDIPVVCLWRDERGWPLWAATDMYPLGEQTEHRQWLHRRFPADRADFGSKLKVNLAAGPYKEKRVPVSAIACMTWLGAALATDVDAVRRLIERVRSLGARAAAGFGAVHAWTVEPFDCDERFILERRAVPIASGLRGGHAARMPWTPPYWHASLWADCVEAAPCF